MWNSPNSSAFGWILVLMLDFFSHIIKPGKFMFLDVINRKIYTFFSFFSFTRNLQSFFIVFIKIKIFFLSRNATSITLLYNIIYNNIFLLFYHPPCDTHGCFVSPASQIFLPPVRDGLNLSLSCRRNKQKPKMEDRGQLCTVALMRGADRDQLRRPK